MTDLDLVSARKTAGVAQALGISQTTAGTRSLRPCGTRAAYERHRKRGEPIDEACREANRLAQESRRALVVTAPGDVHVPHGLNGYDNYRCRCGVCRGAKSRRNAADRRKRLREQGSA